MKERPGSLKLIGDTPLYQVSKLDTGCCSLFLKLESQNPGGSIKDRIGLSMIETAEAEGKLKPGSVLVEATAGNTGLGLALVAAQKGYRIILVIPDKMSQEKVCHLRALGADVVLTRSDVGKGHPQYYHDLAQNIAQETENSFYINQFENPANPKAHYESTGPEIWQQCDGNLDAIVCGVGSGGTITGLSQYFAEVAPELAFVLAEPKGSVLHDLVKTGKMGTAGSWLVEGIGEDFLPDLCDLSRVKDSYLISDKESFDTARALLKSEGLLGGSSTGTLLAAALRYCRAQTEPKRVVTFVCDSGNKYLSKMFNDYWMMDNRFLESSSHGDLRDLIVRKYDEGGVIFVSPQETMATAFHRMKIYDVSQIPVVENDEIVGLLDESDLLLAINKNKDSFKAAVSDYMSDSLKSVTPDSSLDEVIALLKQGYTAIVKDESNFYGLLTEVDVLNYLRLQAEDMVE